MGSGVFTETSAMPIGAGASNEEVSERGRTSGFLGKVWTNTDDGEDDQDEEQCAEHDVEPNLRHLATEVIESM